MWYTKKPYKQQTSYDLYSFIHSFISIQPLGRFSRNHNPVRRPVWLWHTASWGKFLGVGCHCFPLMIYISSNNVRHSVTKTFTTLHPTPLHSTSLHLSTLHFLSFKLHPAILHSPLICHNSIQTSYRSISLHITTLHLVVYIQMLYNCLSKCKF
jgi:hypothetical protein